jgi:hypothetical protein
MAVLPTNMACADVLKNNATENTENTEKKNLTEYYRGTWLCVLCGVFLVISREYLWHRSGIRSSISAS